MKLATYSGVVFDPIYPDETMIRLDDIAHHLGQIIRFGGCTMWRYSVAQHCLGVADLLRQRNKSIRLQFLGLIHDAAEAYIGDIITPVKTELTEVKTIESGIMDAIYRRFDIHSPTEAEHGEVKQADWDCLLHEAYYLCRDRGVSWKNMDGVDVGPCCECIAISEDSTLSPGLATHRFVNKFKSLKNALVDESL